MRSSTNDSREFLVDILELRSQETPDLDAFVWFCDDLSEQRAITYSYLHARAKSLAAKLQQCYPPGDRAVLIFPHGTDFIVAFFACLYAGLIAVPVCPPRRGRPAPRMDGIVKNSQPTVVLSTSEWVEQRTKWFEQIPELLRPKWCSSDQPAAAAQSWQKPCIDADTLALLQYTSGTTGAPKGVMVSHGNLHHNAATIRNALGSGKHPRRAYWLPMYHDMGLIGAMIQTVFDGATSACISPSTYLRQPLSWLELITRTGASFSGAPDFAYDLCVKRSTPETRQGLDLSSWKVAVSGAETIRPATISRFCEAFSPHGFRAETFQPGYGLAEATLVVSHVPHEVAPESVRVSAASLGKNEAELVEDDGSETTELASSGYVGRSQHVAIVDSERRPCRPGQIGEIWVSGPNVASGYYNDEIATEATFHARLPNDERSYLRTGDLGFLLAGQLYVAGRLKELIVIRGRNIYPLDVERIIRDCDSRVRGSNNAAFSVDLLGQERLVVVQEYCRADRKTDFEDLGRNIRLAIARASGVEVFDLLFVREGSIPRTTSGKIQRVQCRADYIADRFTPTARWTERQATTDPPDTTREISAAVAAPTKSVDEIRDWLLQCIATRLDVPALRIDEHQAFSEMGFGSLDVVMICDEFEQWLGQRLPPTMLYNYPTIAALSEKLGAPCDEPVILPFSQSPNQDCLRTEVDQLADNELEAFIAAEMAQLANQTQRRAA